VQGRDENWMRGKSSSVDPEETALVRASRCGTEADPVGLDPGGEQAAASRAMVRTHKSRTSYPRKNAIISDTSK
jgi:hypothetical protein